MKPIGFVVRDSAGLVQRGEISAEGAATPIAAGNGQEISLNLRQSDVQGYQRLGSNLQITLADGRVVVLEDFFGASGGENARLFISADGYLNEVDLVEGADGAVYASYGPTEQWGKWSPSDDLIFLDGTEVAHVTPASDDEVSMLGAGLLGGGGLGLLGAGAAVVGGGIIAGGGGGGGGRPRIEPTVDQDGVIAIGGDDATEDDQSILISGTAEPGSEIVVTIGDEEMTTTATDEGTWEVVFEGEDFPEDGEYDVDVTVTEDDGTVTDLDGPDVVIDLTPPDIAFDDGVDSIGDMTNADDHADGVEIGGTGEPGASVEVTIEGVTHETVVAEDGSWGVVFSPEELPGGEYETGVTVVTTDSFGNSTTVTDTVVIDTLVGVGIDSGQAGGDDLINGAEQEAGVTLTGTAEAGSSVVVTMNGYSHETVADASGNWSVDFASSEIPTGETEATITAVAADAAGNVTETESTIRIDTVNSVTFDAGAVEGDGIVNAEEHADGVTFSGTTQPGASVIVEANGASHSVTADASGNWSVDFAASELPVGETDLEVNVSSTDAAGNIATTSGTVQIDTVNSVTFDAGAVEGDGMVNAAERADGVTLTGTTQAGSSVTVEVGGNSYIATVDASGGWSVDLPASAVPEGETGMAVNVSSTDANGNVATTSGTVEIDTINSVTVETATVESDGVVNAVERADGVTLTGMTQPGAAVSVEVNDSSYTATVDAGGGWSVNLPAGAVPEGETDLPVNVTSTDAAGNVATAAGTVEIDTYVRDFALTDTGGGSDGVVNAAEAASGVTLTGTVEPGSAVVVEMNGVSRNATVASDGSWSVSYPASEVPEGELSVPVTATATDAAGNVETMTGSVEIDTANSVTFSGAEDADGVINATEIAGVTLTGTTDPGSEVSVTVDGVSFGPDRVSVDASGNWSLDLAPGEIAGGTRDAAVSVSSTDAAGNTAQTSGTVRIDTENHVTITDMPGSTVNIEDAASGVSVGGTTDAGASVEVTLGSAVKTVTVDASGNWTATFDIADLGPVEGELELNAVSTDQWGNVADTSATTVNLSVDTVAPEGTRPISVNDLTSGGYGGVTVEDSGDALAVYQANEATGTVSEVDNAQSANWGQVGISFNPGTPVPDGSDLVITATDDAGNMSGTFMALNDATGITSDQVIDLGAVSGLGAYQIETIELNNADHAQLTITEEMLTGLSTNSDTVVVQGGADDTVTISGGERAAAGTEVTVGGESHAVGADGSVEIGGQSFDVYTLGDTGALIIDDDVNVVI